MKTPVSLLLFAMLTIPLFGQEPDALYQQRFSYDLKQDKESVSFDGKTFWLRVSRLSQKTLTLTYLLKGETPTTASESITVLLLPPAESVESFKNKLLEQTKALRPVPPEVIKFDEFQGGEQQIVTFLIQDKTNNLVQDSVTRLTKWKEKNLSVVIHSIRLKLSEVSTNSALAQKMIGDRRQNRLKAITYFNLPF